MKGYNLYFNETKLNSVPLTRDDVKIIQSNKYINKKIDNSTVQKILVKDIKIVECIIV